MLEITVSESMSTNENPQNTECTVHRTQLQSFLRELKGRFVGVDFVKQDGSVRALNGRLGVHSYCQGGENKTVKDSRPYLTIFDVKSSGYRTLNLATVSALRANRKVYSIVD